MGRPKSKTTKPRKPPSSKRAAANRNYLQETKNAMLQDIFMSHNSQTANEIHEDHGAFLERAMLRNSLEIVDQEIETELARGTTDSSSLPAEKPVWSNGAAAPKKGIRCSVLYCNSRFGSVDSAGKKVTFHRFPRKGTYQRGKWIHTVNMDSWEPNESSFMCSLHFDPSDFIYYSDSQTTNLKPEAVPIVVPTWSSKVAAKNSAQTTESEKVTTPQVAPPSHTGSSSGSVQTATPKEAMTAAPSSAEREQPPAEEENVRQPQNQPCKASTPKTPMYCHAVNCCTVHTRESDIKLFSFPLDMDRCKQWILNCRRQDFLKMKPGVAHRYYNLCANHFEDHHFVCPMARDCLLPDALPTRFDLPEVPPNLSPEPPSSSAAARKKARFRRGLSERTSRSEDDLSSRENITTTNPVIVRKGTDISLPSEVFRAPGGGPRLRHAPAQTGDGDVPFTANKWTMTDRVSTERELYLENRLELCQDLLQKSQRRVEMLQEQAAGQSKSYAVEDLAEGAAKYLSGLQLHFFANQLQLHGKNKATCNRFPKEVKEFAKTMYAASPKAYRLLSKEFTLPVIRTMQMMVRTVQDKIGTVIEEVAGARVDGGEPDDDTDHNAGHGRRPFQRKSGGDPGSTSQQPTDMESTLTTMMGPPLGAEQRHLDAPPPPSHPPHPPPPLKKAPPRDKHPHHHHQMGLPSHQQQPPAHQQQPPPHHHHHHHHHQMPPAVQQQQQQQQHQHQQQQMAPPQEFMPPHTMSDCLMPMPGGGGGGGNGADGYYSGNGAPLFTAPGGATMLSHPYQSVNNFFFPPDDVQQRSYYYLPTTK